MKGLLWRCKSIALALQEHCFGIAGASFLRCRSIALCLLEAWFGKQKKALEIEIPDE
jgi:hypothetical protein